MQSQYESLPMEYQKQCFELKERSFYLKRWKRTVAMRNRTDIQTSSSSRGGCLQSRDIQTSSSSRGGCLQSSNLESELVTAVAEEMMAAEASQVPFPRHHAMDGSSGLGMLKLIDCMKLVYETDIWTQHRGVQYLCDS